MTKGLERSGWGPRAVLAAMVLLGVEMGGASAHAACTLIPAPCNPAASTGSQIPGAHPTPTPASSFAWERSCKDYYNGAAPIPATSTQPVPIPSYTGLVQQIQTQLQKHATCFYHGIDPDPYGQKNPQVPGCTGDPTWGTPCSLVPNPLNSFAPAEANTNYLGGSCGKPMQITSVGRCDTGTPDPLPPELVAAINQVPDHPPIAEIESGDISQAELKRLEAQIAVINPALLPSLTDSAKGWTKRQSVCMYMTKAPQNAERSWLRGAFIQALAYYEKQVISEIQSTHQIQIPSQSKCLALASEVGSLQNQTGASSGTLLSRIANGQQTKNISDIVNCTADWNSVQVGPGAGLDRGQLRQSAQYLCAARTGIESAFVQLAVCEIYERAQDDYLARTQRSINSPDLSGFLDQAEQVIDHQPPYNCRNKCKDAGSKNALKNCANSCYSQNIQQYMTTTFKNWWPMDQAPVSFSCFGIALLGPGLSKRRKRRSKKKRRSRARAIMLMLALLICAWLISACGSSSMPAVPIPPPASGCDGSSCTTGGSGVIEGSQVSGATALAGGTGALNSANALLGSGSTAATTGAQSPGTSGAASGNGMGGAGSAGAASPEIAAAAPGGAGGAGPLGGGNNGGPSDQFSYGNDNGAGAPAPAASPGPDVASYGASGGGGGSAAKQSGWNFFGGFGGGDGGLSGTSGENAFGKDVPPMVSRDPANYFTMIDPSESLFKRVDNRYQQTAISWASSAAVNMGTADIHGGVISVHPRK